jgi:hypothetical protein
MLRVLKFVPAVEVPGPGAALAPARRVLHAVLLRVAERAARLAARLEQAEARARAPAKVVAAVRPYAPAGALGLKLAEAVVLLAVAGYFAVGLVCVFVA